MEKTVEQIEEERIETERVEEAKFEKKVTSETDKRMTSAMQKKEAEYKEKLAEADRKSKLNEEEKEKEKEKELAEREAKITSYEFEISKTNLSKTKGYDSEIVDNIKGDTLEEIEANTKKMIAYFDGKVEKQVVERLKNNSYTPPKGGNASGEKNPWAKETFNLTEQGKMLKNNPTLATSYMNKK